jgi:hypothetical protein
MVVYMLFFCKICHFRIKFPGFLQKEAVTAVFESKNV